MLFDTSNFIPRGQVGDWTETLQFLYLFSNALIVLSYLLISLELFILWIKRHLNLKYPSILFLFILFIFFCGITHLTDILAFWWPAYRFFILITFIAGILSIITALLIPFKIRFLLSLKTPNQYVELTNNLEKINHENDINIGILKQANINLLRQIKRLENIKRSDIWIKDQEEILKNLKFILKDMEIKNGV